MSTAILCLVCVLWPFLALDGGLAFNSVAGLAALFMLGSVRHFRPRWYMAALAIFFLYAAISVLWSPQPFQLIEIDFARHAFNMRSEVVRVGLTFLALAVVLTAALHMNERARLILSRFVTVALLVQLAACVVLALFEKQALDLFAPLMANSGEGVQNISRNNLIMAVAAPALVFNLIESRSRTAAILIAVVVIGLEAAVLLARGVDAGLLVLVAAILSIVAIRLFPKHGFRLIAGGVASLILVAPLLFGFISRGANASLAATSAEYREAIWRRVMEVIESHPVTGAGVGVLRTIQERIPDGVFAGNLLVPNHAHNMTLQLWAETGAHGAVLLALAIFLAGWRLPSPQVMGRAAPRVAGLIAGMTVIACVSFDLWREWWWAVGGLLAAFAAALPKTPEPSHGISIGDDEPYRDPAPDDAVPDRDSSFASTTPEAVPEAVVGYPEAPSAAAGDPLSQERTGRRAPSLDNNFNLLRLVFALMVVMLHLVSLSGVAAWSRLVKPLSVGAELGVQGFFVLSGFLVFGSFERSATLVQYAGKRVRRLYPAYAAIILICVAAALVFAPQARADLAGVVRYLGWNLAFLNFLAPNLPGLFVGNTYPDVNGALWTLKIEVLFYLVLPVLAWSLRAAGGWRWALIIAIYIAAEAWRIGLTSLGTAENKPLLIEMARQLPGQMSFFMTGAAFYLWRDWIKWRWWLMAAGVVLLTASLMFPIAEPLRALGLGTVAIGAAIALPPLFDAARFGDLSYGLYIIHFPVIQTIVAIGLFAVSPWLGLSAAITVALTGALAMWWLVERPALRADSAYRHHA